MTFLATVIGNKLKYQPVTDQFRGSFSRNYQKGENFEIYKTQKKRELILKELIPYPENFDLKKLRRFKDNHLDLLERFRNKTEQIVLNPSAEIDSPFFQESLRELKFRKEELSARMNESRLGPIFSCYYSLSGRLLQVPRTGLFFTRSYRPRYGRAPFPVPAPADPCRALPPPACSPASAASQGEGAAAPANAFPESPGHRSDPPPASQ